MLPIKAASHSTKKQESAAVDPARALHPFVRRRRRYRFRLLNKQYRRSRWRRREEATIRWSERRKRWGRSDNLFVVFGESTFISFAIMAGGSESTTAQSTLKTPRRNRREASNPLFRFPTTAFLLPAPLYQCLPFRYLSLQPVRQCSFSVCSPAAMQKSTSEVLAGAGETGRKTG
jgi:hypothetical protein